LLRLIFAAGLYAVELWQGGNPSGELVIVAAAERVIGFFKNTDRSILIAAFWGLWWGAASHTIVDATTSAIKQIFKLL
jgi:hypothetical protein